MEPESRVPGAVVETVGSVVFFFRSGEEEAGEGLGSDPPKSQTIAPNRGWRPRGLEGVSASTGRLNAIGNLGCRRTGG